MSEVQDTLSAGADFQDAPCDCEAAEEVVDQEAVALELAERNALAAVFDDVREQSSDSQLVEPTRWVDLELVPAHMTADEFEMFVYEYLEDQQAAAQEQASEDEPAVVYRSATRAVGVPPAIVAPAPVEEPDGAASVDCACSPALDDAVLEVVDAGNLEVVDAAVDLDEVAASEPSVQDDRSPFANLNIPAGYRLVELEGEWVLVPTDEDPEPVERVVDCTGIVALVGAHSYYLYDSGRMTDTFAHWAFLAAEDNNVVTFVDCVREESRVYPRPLPASSLKNPPFRLTDEEIDRAWDEVCESGLYPDVQQTRASNGDVYYFSTEYLTPTYAGSLAEWASVERYMNV